VGAWGERASGYKNLVQTHTKKGTKGSSSAPEKDQPSENTKRKKTEKKKKTKRVKRTNVSQAQGWGGGSRTREKWNAAKIGGKLTREVGEKKKKNRR